MPTYKQKCTNRTARTALVPDNKKTVAYPILCYGLFVYRQKAGSKSVNIFHKYNYHITALLPTLYKTYCFAFQKRRFCTVKAAVLRYKTTAFAMPNRNCCFSKKLSLQNQGYC
ncbi:hypothetical protein CTM63_09450 [Prevotella intermedia]|nr:hypothetical protein CTM63_09450 [Prevotella intermedia]